MSHQTQSHQSASAKAFREPRHLLRRWCVRFLIFPLLPAVLLIGLAPTLLSTQWARPRVLAFLNGEINGKLDAREWSLSWLGPNWIKGLTVTDVQGRTSLDAQSIKLSRGLAALIFTRSDYGQIDLSDVRLSLFLDDQNRSSLEHAIEFRAAEPDEATPRSAKNNPQSALRDLAIAAMASNGQLRIVNANGAEYVVKDIDGRVCINTLNDLVVQVSAATPDGKFSIDVDLKDFFLSSRGPFETAGGRVKIQAGPAIDIEPLLTALGAGIHGTGRLTIDAQATLAPGQMTGRWNISLAGLSANAPDSKQAVTPTDLSLSGEAWYLDKKLTVKNGLDGQIANLKASLEYVDAEPSVAMRAQRTIDLLMAGKSMALPESAVSVSGKIDLGAAGQCIPALMQLRKDVRLTAGSIDLTELAFTGGQLPSAQASAKFTATIMRGSEVRTLDPIEVGLKITTDATGRMKIDRVGVQASFLQLQASGYLTQMDAEFSADLAKANQQLAEVFDLGQFAMSGMAAGSCKVARKETADSALSLATTVNLSQVRIGSVSAKSAAVDTGEQGPPTYSGQVNWLSSVEQDGYKLALDGTLEVASFARSDVGEAPRSDLPTLTHKMVYDTLHEQLSISKIELTSKPLTLELAGIVIQPLGEGYLDLKGRYTSSWPDLMAIARRISPQVADDLAMVGQSQGQIVVNGSLFNPAIRPGFGQMTGRTVIGWAGGSKAYGLAMGEARLEPSLRNAQITLPQTAILCNSGMLRLGGLADLRGRDPVVRIDGKMMVLENVTLNEEIGREILSRVLPLLGEVSTLQGRVSLCVQDVSLPLDAQIRKTGKGSGRLDLSDIHMVPKGELSRLMKILSIPGSEACAVTMSPVDFEITRGGILYKNLTLTFKDGFDVRFRGTVHFDDKVDLVMSLPVKAGLLDVLGVKGPTTKHAELFEGMRVEIPLVGTRMAPKMDLTKVDLKPLVQQAVKKTAAAPVSTVQVSPAMLSLTAKAGKQTAASKPAPRGRSR